MNSKQGENLKIIIINQEILMLYFDIYGEGRGLFVSRGC